MSKPRRRPPRPLRPRSQYADLSAEMHTLGDLMDGSRAVAYRTFARLQEWLPEVVADRYAQAAQQLARCAGIPADVGAFFLVTFGRGVARARLARSRKYRAMESAHIREIQDNVIAWASGRGQRWISSAQAQMDWVVDRRTVDYLREIGETRLAEAFDENDAEGPWVDGEETLFGVLFSGMRWGLELRDGSVPSQRQLDRAVVYLLEARERDGVDPPFRKMLELVADEDGIGPAPDRSCS